MANISESLAENLTGMRNTFTRTTKKDSEKKTSDIASEGFTGKDKKAGKASVTNAFYTTISEGQQKPLRVGDSIADVFAKIYNLLKMQYDEQKERYELEQDAINKNCPVCDKEINRKNELICLNCGYTSIIFYAKKIFVIIGIVGEWLFCEHIANVINIIAEAVNYICS